MPEARSYDLEAALVALAARLDVPDGPNLAPRVRSAIETAPPHRPARRLLPRLQPALAMAAVVAMLVAGLLLFSPTTREAIADWIGLDGVRITSGDPPAAIAEDLLLGERVDLEEARARAGFDLKTLGNLGPPDEIYVREDRPGAKVSFVYGATADLPRTAETRVGAVFSQFPASEVDVAVKKVTGEAEVIPVIVAGASGYWLGGGPHVVSYVDPEGRVGADQVRLAGNTLLWQRGGIVYRLESALGMDSAIELAESLR
jgi:hypothetical protein